MLTLVQFYAISCGLSGKLLCSGCHGHHESHDGASTWLSTGIARSGRLGVASHSQRDAVCA